MTADGNIMKNILLRFVTAGKPALGIHDSIVCRSSDIDFTRHTMTDVYFEFLQFEPVINRVY